MKSSFRTRAQAARFQSSSSGGGGDGGSGGPTGRRARGESGRRPAWEPGDHDGKEAERPRRD